MCHAKRLLELPNSNLIEAARWIINLFPREHKAHWTSQCWEPRETQREKERERNRGKDGENTARSAVPAHATIPWTLPESDRLYNTVRAWCHAPHHHPGNRSTCVCLCAERNKEINLLTTEHKWECEKGQRQKNKGGIKALARKKAPWDDGWGFCRYYCCSWGTQPI